MKRFWREIWNLLFIAAGILSAGMGLKGFLLSSSFIDGGVTGVSMLLAKITTLPLSLWLPVINVPFIVLGYHQIGRAFAVRSVVGISGLAAVLAMVHYPDVTPDHLLTEGAREKRKAQRQDFERRVSLAFVAFRFSRVGRNAANKVDEQSAISVLKDMRERNS